jgi:hypothetical protein
VVIALSSGGDCFCGRRLAASKVQPNQIDSSKPSINLANAQLDQCGVYRPRLPLYLCSLIMNLSRQEFIRVCNSCNHIRVSYLILYSLRRLICNLYLILYSLSIQSISFPKVVLVPDHTSTRMEYEDVVLVPHIISPILDSMSTSSAEVVAIADS